MIEREANAWAVRDGTGLLRGRIYQTAHPTLLYEAFKYDDNPSIYRAIESRRLMTLEEGEKYILSEEEEGHSK